MQLLPKKKVNTEVAEHRRLLIEEGVNLAKKVDTLRETLVSLQEQHQKFLDGMQASLNEKISALVAEADERKKEVEALDRRRQELLIPLDAAWVNLNKQKEEVIRDADELSKKLKEVVAEKARLDERSKKTKEILTEVRTREHELARAYVKAEELLVARDSLVAEAEELKQKAQVKLKEADELITQAEAKRQFEEEANANYKKILEEKESELNIRERQVNDRYETLLRTEKRLKKHNG